MSQTMRKPVPTDYRGNRFRSKSEAMFAWCLDQLPMSYRWRYEPPEVERATGHAFDFELSWMTCPLEDWVSNYFPRDCALIEYKPAIVTDAYRETLAEKITWPVGLGFSFWLVQGSFFDPHADRRCEVLQEEGMFATEWKGWPYWLEAAAKQVIYHRFDLA